jgi:3-isopropylmalate/(R)-2-methylmalate dehydratase small subunit
MIACELPAAVLDEIFREFSGPDTELAVDTAKGSLCFRAEGREKIVPFTLEGFEKALVEAGGWVEYAARKY